MRIAIPSDIHANREASDVVPEVVREREWDELVLLGAPRPLVSDIKNARGSVEARRRNGS